MAQRDRGCPGAGSGGRFVGFRAVSGLGLYSQTRVTPHHLNNLAHFLEAAERADEAEPLFERVITIWQATLGPNHPHTQTAKRNLAELKAQSPK